MIKKDGFYFMPDRYNDPTGEIPIDIIWDASNVVVDITRLTVAAVKEDDAGVKNAAADLFIDTIAMVIPYAPAGVSKIGKVAVKTAEVAKGIYDAKENFEDGDYLGGALTISSTAIGVVSGFCNKKFDIDLAEAAQRRGLTPPTCRTGASSAKAEFGKNVSNGVNLSFKSTASGYSILKSSHNAGNSNVERDQSKTDNSSNFKIHDKGMVDDR